MRCPSCNFEIPAGKKFCSECGAELQRHCPQCNAEVLSTARFCSECGVLLSAPASLSVSETQSINPPRQVGERRHLSVLFCDLVGSTAISAQLDPEEWRETIARYHGAASEAITRFDGHVAKYLGDGVMAYFGWPAAHDNDDE